MCVSMSLIPSGELKVDAGKIADDLIPSINESNSLRGVERADHRRYFHRDG